MDTDSILPFNGGCEDCPMENVSWKMRRSLSVDNANDR